MFTNNNWVYNLWIGSPASTAPPPLDKVKVFTFGAILLKFETQQYHMCTNNNLNLNPPPLKKVKLFIYGAIMLEFETQHFHMFINNKL